VLEIGGGIGTIQVELLKAGAESGEVVELVGAYEPYARELAREADLEARTRFRVADVLESTGIVEAADVVILNRVVCCTSDGIALAGEAARLARRTLVLSFPRNVRWVRAGVRVANLGLRVIGRSYRIFLHSRPSLIAAVEAEGLRLSDSGRRGGWEFVAFSRAT
jgi:magnesium-protoporphyrin O-methyltransferase